LARRQDPGGKIGLIRGDFRAHPFAPATFSMITSVAALHHMDARATLDRMSQLLAPGGRLAIVGLARSRLPADLPWEAGAVIAHWRYKLARTYWEQPSPLCGRLRTPTPRYMPWPGRRCRAPGTAATSCGATHLFGPSRDQQRQRAAI
jgi:SAM-dependent methyltransferase